MYKLNPFTYTFSDRLKAKKIALKSPVVLNKNETVAIIGPSGGGKSTLLKILKGIIPEYSSGKLEGEILFNGHPLSGPYFQENLQKILYLFQNPFSQIIYPTTEEEFLFSMENFNFSREEMERQKDKFEKLFGLKALWGKKTSELSNGECQKLVLASMLAIDPEVLLLDEPTAFLDPHSRKEFYEYLKVIRRDRLVIIVDHHVDEIKSFVDKVLYVDEEGNISESSFDKEKEAAPSSDMSLLSLKKTTEVTIRLDRLSFSYPSSYTFSDPLLREISATFNSGEVLAIKGKNGAGKSTLFKLLSGVLAPTSGSVEIEIDKKIIKRNHLFSHVGFVFQNPEAHFFFDTIEEELKQSFRQFSGEKKKMKDQILERFFHDIDLKKSPFLLSEGEKRRLSILMTVFLNKELILYDEPTFGQDQSSIEKIEELILSLKKMGLIQVFISHDETFIHKVADRVFILESGGLYEVPPA